ncbi:hypothetical protein [Weissella hellenica]|uniref:ABC-2 type transport system permease protein n=1 Tax=Weissella hellenica TaxID=46256 RepID=A0A4Y4G078_WEIHE|nr:hypothetical protein [Weissella hellenica]NKY66617.1 hypothetical protein [Weissella hellenica]GED35193.1 hypothetical protein WHE01_00970 [Weissella hellenica]SCB94541.1 ABC-2 type transport system permease protein [Weissella hellenica]
MNKVKALYKVYIVSSLNNKVVFMYNLLLPIVYLLATNLKYFFQPVQTTNQELINTASYFWAYIIIVTLLNMVTFEMLSERESGYFKELFFIVGSKWHILLADLLAQVTILVLEITLFNIVFLVIFRTINFGILLGGLLATLLLTIPVTCSSCIFLILKVKAQTAPIIETITLFGMFTLLGIKNENTLIKIVNLLNPVEYLAQNSNNISLLMLGNIPSGTYVIQFITITTFYILIGVWGLSKFTISPIENRA